MEKSYANRYQQKIKSNKELNDKYLERKRKNNKKYRERKLANEESAKQFRAKRAYQSKVYRRNKNALIGGNKLHFDREIQSEAEFSHDSCYEFVEMVDEVDCPVRGRRIQSEAEFSHDSCYEFVEMVDEVDCPVRGRKIQSEAEFSHDSCYEFVEWVDEIECPVRSQKIQSEVSLQPIHGAISKIKPSCDKTRKFSQFNRQFTAQRISGYQTKGAFYKALRKVKDALPKDFFKSSEIIKYLYEKMEMKNCQNQNHIEKNPMFC